MAACEFDVLLFTLTVWAFLTRVSTTPAADFCGRIRVNYFTLSHEIRDRPQISRDKFGCFRYATAGFTTSVLDGYGLRCPLPTRPTPSASNPILVHRPVFLVAVGTPVT